MKLIFTNLIILCLLLAGCADEDNSEPPAELVSFTPAATFDAIWKVATGDGAEHEYLIFEPLVLGKRIITASRDGDITVIDVETGDVVEQIELEVDLSSGVGGNNTVWVVASKNAEIIAISAKDYSVLWKTRVTSEILASPVVNDDFVIVRTIDGQIYSLDLLSGKIKWQFQQTVPQLTLRGSNTPLLSQGRVIAGLENGHIIALSAIDGEVLWNITLANPLGGSEIQRLVDIDGKTVLSGNILYATSFQGRIAALDTKKGQYLWSRKFSSNSGVAVNGNAVYSTDERGYVWALDRYNGATLWKQDMLQARAVTRPVIYDKYLVVGDFEGYLHLLSKIDGHFIARVKVDTSGFIMPPTVNGKNLYAFTRNGLLVSYSLNSI